MTSGGIHRSITDPPKTVVVASNPIKKGSSVEAMANVVQKLASAITTPITTDQIMEKSSV